MGTHAQENARAGEAPRIATGETGNKRCHAPRRVAITNKESHFASHSSVDTLFVTKKTLPDRRRSIHGSTLHIQYLDGHRRAVRITPE